MSQQARLDSPLHKRDTIVAYWLLRSSEVFVQHSFNTHSYYCFLIVTGSQLKGAWLRNCGPITVVVVEKNKCLKFTSLGGEGDNADTYSKGDGNGNTTREPVDHRQWPPRFLGSIPGGVAPGFSYVGIVLRDAVDADGNVDRWEMEHGRNVSDGGNGRTWRKSTGQRRRAGVTPARGGSRLVVAWPHREQTSPSNYGCGAPLACGCARPNGAARQVARVSTLGHREEGGKGVTSKRGRGGVPGRTWPLHVGTPFRGPDPPGYTYLAQEAAATCPRHLCQSRLNEGAGETGDIRENPPTSGTSSGTIPTCENSGATSPGIAPGSSRWEASILTTTQPRPRCRRLDTRQFQAEPQGPMSSRAIQNHLLAVGIQKPPPYLCPLYVTRLNDYRLFTINFKMCSLYREQPITWEREYRHSTLDTWKRVDESKYQTRSQALDERPRKSDWSLSTRVQHGGCGNLVWGLLTCDGVGPLVHVPSTLIDERCRWQIMCTHFCAYGALQDTCAYKLQQDNAPVHPLQNYDPRTRINDPAIDKTLSLWGKKRYWVTAAAAASADLGVVCHESRSVTQCEVAPQRVDLVVFNPPGKRACTSVDLQKTSNILCVQALEGQGSPPSTITKRWNAMEGKRECPEKTRRSMATSATFPIPESLDNKQLLTNFARGNRAGRCRWSTGFLGYFLPTHSGAAPFPPRFTLVRSLKTSLLRGLCSCASKVKKKRGSDTGDSYTHAKRLIAPTRKACILTLQLAEKLSIVRGARPSTLFHFPFRLHSPPSSGAGCDVAASSMHIALLSRPQSKGGARTSPDTGRPSPAMARLTPGSRHTTPRLPLRASLPPARNTTLRLTGPAAGAACYFLPALLATTTSLCSSLHCVQPLYYSLRFLADSLLVMCLSYRLFMLRKRQSCIITLNAAVCEAFTHKCRGHRVTASGTQATRIARCFVTPAGRATGIARQPLRIDVHNKGAVVAERLARSPPTKAYLAQSPAGSPDFRMWESCRTMPLVGGHLPLSPPPHSGAVLYSPKSPSSALKTSLLRAAQISSLTHLHLKLILPCARWSAKRRDIVVNPADKQNLQRPVASIRSSTIRPSITSQTDARAVHRASRSQSANVYGNIKGTDTEFRLFVLIQVVHPQEKPGKQGKFKEFHMGSTCRMCESTAEGTVLLMKEGGRWRGSKTMRQCSSPLPDHRMARLSPLCAHRRQRGRVITQVITLCVLTASATAVCIRFPSGRCVRFVNSILARSPLKSENSSNENVGRLHRTAPNAVPSCPTRVQYGTGRVIVLARGVNEHHREYVSRFATSLENLENRKISGNSKIVREIREMSGNFKQRSLFSILRGEQSLYAITSLTMMSGVSPVYVAAVYTLVVAALLVDAALANDRNRRQDRICSRH
ncbi:hypothetical protein PR048_009936 [Dryococelus australis]|uniref:Uncharacterized protein n=1 Tax=Dryococelus australis TaxID=614101 RepID=A0ABQ9I1D6_9NEOP|nr:hypothetical protein PR048_009936 [Dryococelus australis]